MGNNNRDLNERCRVSFGCHLVEVPSERLRCRKPSIAEGQNDAADEAGAAKVVDFIGGIPLACVTEKRPCCGFAHPSASPSVLDE